MNAIRPPAPSILFPTQAPPAPARSSRSTFFQAALEGLRAAAPGEPTASVETPAPAPAAVASADRQRRPGALLDIRV